MNGLRSRLKDGKVELPVKKGEEKGKYVMELTTGERITWEFMEGKDDALYITTGGLISTKSKISKSLISDMFPEQFDIDEFIRAEPRNKVKIIKNLSGLNTDLIDAKINEAVENRAKYKKLASEISVTEKDLKEIPVSKFTFDELKADLEQVEKEQKENFDLSIKKSSNQRAIQDFQKAALSLEVEIENLKKIIEIKLNDLKECKDAIVELESKEFEEEKPAEFFAEKRGQILEEIKKLNESDLVNQQNELIKKQIETKAEYLKKEKEFDEAVTVLRAEKRSVLKSVKLPDGIEINEEMTLFVDGFPLNENQISSSKLYIAGLKLAAMKMGEIKYLHFDASHLDKNSLEDILTYAETQGLQLLIERPDFEGGEIQIQIFEK